MQVSRYEFLLVENQLCHSQQSCSKRICVSNSKNNYQTLASTFKNFDFKACHVAESDQVPMGEVCFILVVIDFDDWRFAQIYSRGEGVSRGDLVIKEVSYEERGLYKCWVQTKSDSATLSAIVTVYGKLIRNIQHFYRPSAISVIRQLEFDI